MRVAALIPLLAVSLAAAQDDRIAIRHGGEHDMGHGTHETSIASSSSIATSTSSLTATLSSSSSAPSATPHPPDPHSHHSHAPVKEYLDDEDIHYWHKFPPTYLDADFRLTNDSVIFGEELPADWPAGVPSHPGLMILHVVSMVVAYFGILPITLALRAAGHPSHYLCNTVFLATAIVGWFFGVAYKAAMPDLYQGAKHGRLGSLLVLLSIALAAVDSLGLISRGVAYYRAGNTDWKHFFHDAIQNAKEEHNRYEMVRVSEDHHAVFKLDDDEDDDEDVPTRPSASRTSTGSEGTLQDPPSSSSGSAHMFEMGSDRFRPKTNRRAQGHFDDEWPEAHETEKTEKTMTKKRLAGILLTWVRRVQVVAAYIVVVTGIPVYLGMCRAGFINTCAAHMIKGSIFFGYGVLTFARYLGAYADMGWAWNRKPEGSRAASAEMVECSVIFVYGITNTWMERFGAKAGDPYTVKQVQHISIAIMFWFAGLSGILLESPSIRRILGAVIYTGSRRRVQQPPSYAFSFNPFPALVIAITGLAMAAHHQDYKFQVEIHSLWGWLLAGGSLFRFLTYFYLWLRPPTESTLPSRPPTEVLTSFGWAAGGIVFMLSDEEVAFAAMRSGFDDMMAFLNITVALTCFIFCWIVVVLAVKGYALFRLRRGVQLDEAVEA